MFVQFKLAYEKKFHLCKRICAKQLGTVLRRTKLPENKGWFSSVLSMQTWTMKFIPYGIPLRINLPTSLVQNDSLNHFVPTWSHLLSLVDSSWCITMKFRAKLQQHLNFSPSFFTLNGNRQCPLSRDPNGTHRSFWLAQSEWNKIPFLNDFQRACSLAVIASWFIIFMSKQ